MTEIKRRSIDTHYENQITTAMIMSTKFLTEIRPLFNPDYMKNTFAKIICYWCTDYYDHYKKAPGSNIKDIFLVESSSGLAKEDSAIIEEFLARLSKQCTEDQGINDELIRDYAFDYFRKRDLEIRSEETRKLLELGRVEEAEEQFLNFKKVAFQTSGWIDPFDIKEIAQVFEDSSDDSLILPGALGEIVGPIERGWLVGILAPFKRGKSWYMQELAIRGLFQNLKVAFISLEMSRKDVKKRFYKRLTGFGSRSGEDVFLFPIFDCMRNQEGVCDREERTNLIKLMNEDGTKPEFDVDSNYRVCTFCRDNKVRDYKATTWFEPIEVPQFSFKNTKQHILALEDMYGSNIRFICYPRFSAGVQEFKRDLFILEQYENFIPDLIVVDQADILKLGKGEKRNQIDDVWKELASMAMERHSIVITASQGNRGSIYKENISQDDLAEWIGKLGHVDVFLGLSQTADEKSSKIIRTNLLVHRHVEVDESLHAILLQQLDVGQFLMDSQLIRKR